MVQQQTKARRAPFYILCVANVISVSGNIMALIAIPWFVLQTTGSASKTGLTAAVTALPAVIAAFFGGVFVDRIGYKRTSVVADLASCIAIGLIPLLSALDRLEFWHLLVLVFFGNLLDAPGATARRALVPELAERGGISLERASALSDAIFRSSLLIGAPLAGALIGAIGASNVLWIDAVSFLISALLISLGVPVLAGPTTKREQNYVGQLMEGLHFIRSDRLMMAIIGTVMITNFLDAAMSSVIAPVYFKQIFNDPAVLGLASGVLGGMALATALYVGAVGIRWPRRLTFSIAFIIVALRMPVMALVPDVPVLLLIYAMTGLAAGFLNPIMSAVSFSRTPPNMRARVFGVTTAGALLGTPLAGVSGFVLDRIGLIPTLVVCGTLYLVTTLSLLFNPAIRDMDGEAPTGDELEMAAR
jgi:MFS family permease